VTPPPGGAAEAGHAAPSPPGAWPLVERDAHLLRIAAASARRGCRGVVVAGPPGAGKTRLVTAALERAAGEGAPTARVDPGQRQRPVRRGRPPAPGPLDAPG